MLDPGMGEGFLKTTEEAIRNESCGLPRVSHGVHSIASSGMGLFTFVASKIPHVNAPPIACCEAVV